MSAFEDLAHRINNLLGTIEIQAEVAGAEGTLEAHQKALEFITTSAQETRRELGELKRARAAERDQSS